MRSRKRTRPDRISAGAQNTQTKGRGLHGKYSKRTAPRGFWKGWNGPQGMAPAIIRRQPKPADTFWKPNRAGGAS